MPEMILMPRSLTAENGAKGLLNGEFEETITIRCPDCDGDDDECDICQGHGEYEQPVTVSWTTIKAIYKMAVEHLGKEVTNA